MLFYFSLLFCLAYEGEGAWEIGNTGIFQPLRTDEVIVAPGGEIFILNFKEAHIVHYDENGQQKGSIGFKGKGPGGLTYPVSFFLQDDRLYVQDLINSSVSLFQAKDGAFLKRVRLPRRNLTLAKVSTGWLYGDWGAAENAGQPSRLYWADTDFEKSELLYTLQSSGIQGGMTIENNNGEVNAVFTPLSSQPELRVSWDGRLAYLSEPEGFEIQVIDAERRQIAHTVKRAEAPIPFDEEWGLERRAQIDKMRPSRDRQIKIKNDFPEYFPVVRDMRLDVNGHLVVDKWMGRPDKRHNLIALDPTGKEKAASHDWEVLSRLVAVRGSWAYITIFDNENEEAGLARCPLSEVERFVAETPIEFEGMAGRMISMED